MTHSRIDSLLTEAATLDEILRVQRERYALEEESINRLKDIQRTIRPPVQELNPLPLFHTLTDQIDKEIRYRSHEQIEKTARLDQIPQSEDWDEFIRLVTLVKAREEAHQRAANDAREYLNSSQFWYHARHTATWCDLRLPAEDVRYRIAIERLNNAKMEAFTFYHQNQGKLHEFHKSRFDALNCLVSSIDINSSLSRGATLTEEQASIISTSSGAMAASDPANGEDGRGSFTLVKHVNYLNNEQEGYPIFGLSLGSTGGWLARLILRGNTHNDIWSPPLPIFTPVIPEAGGLEEHIRAAFRMESLWDGHEDLHQALEQTMEPDGSHIRVDKGWILGFLLVNLPKPLVGVSDPLTRVPHRGLRTEEIQYVLPKNLELEFFRKIWRHTNVENIGLGAVAMTQCKDTEKIMIDIRSKWNIDTSQPHPSHLVKTPRSPDTLWRKLHVRRSTSGDYSST